MYFLDESSNHEPLVSIKVVMVVIECIALELIGSYNTHGFIMLLFSLCEDLLYYAKMTQQAWVDIIVIANLITSYLYLVIS